MRGGSRSLCGPVFLASCAPQAGAAARRKEAYAPQRRRMDTEARTTFRRLEEAAPGLTLAGRRLRWWLDPRARRSRRRLAAMRSSHLGERCFIIGNGPSLRKMNLGCLRDETTFSLNRGYLLFDRLGFACTYHVAVNPLVIEQWGEDIIGLPCVKFITWNRRHDISRQADLTYIGGPSNETAPRFCKDVAKDIWQGATVTYVALQIAYFLGFSRVILIGVDHRFQTAGEPHQTVISEGDDRDHFDPSYFGKGARWALPDLETSELAYMLARHYYLLDKRQIFDATVDGALQVFPKRPFESFFV